MSWDIALRHAIKKINTWSGMARTIPMSASGNHAEGHRKIDVIFKKINEVLKKKVEGETETVRDYVYNNVPRMRMNGFRVARYGYPVPSLALVKGLHARDNAYLMEAFVCGSMDAFQHFCPVSRKLMTDSAHGLYVDAMPLCTELAKMHENESIVKWYTYDALYEFLELNLDKPYFLEKAGLFELLGMAAQFDMKHTVGAFSLKIYADALMNRIAIGSRRYPLPAAYRKLTKRAVWQGEVPDSLIDREGISEKAWKEISRRFDAFLRPLRRLYKRPVDSGGILNRRCLGNVVLGAQGRTCCLKRPEEADAIEMTASQFASEFGDMMGEDVDPRSNGRTRRCLPVDMADIESSSAARKWMAADHMMSAYSEFLSSSGIRDACGNIGMDLPECPMPFAGPVTSSLETRSMASIMCQLIADIGPSAAVDLPHHLFWSIRDLDEEQEVEAVKQMMKGVKINLEQSLVLEGLMQAYPVTRLMEAWVGYFENCITYTGCGVHSLTEMLWPVFFASEPVFQSCLQYEDVWLANHWRRVRKIVANVRQMIKKREWSGVKKGLEELFSQVEAMGLHVASRPESEQSSDPFPSLNAPPFKAPNTHFGRKVSTTPYSRAPIEFIEASPGSKERYAEMASQNRHRISLLKRLQAQPMSAAANIIGYASTGPVFDGQRIHLLPLGHCVFSTVDYHTPQPCPGMKIQMVFLMDMSASMNEKRVHMAKTIGLIMTEGLINSFDVDFYMYNTNGAFYRVTELMKSSNRRQGGNLALSTLFRKGLESGSGWNPDAAVLNCIAEKYRQSTSGDVIICLISDHEYCQSLIPQMGCKDATDEMAWAIKETLKDDRFHVVLCRVGADANPLPAPLGHHFVYIPDGPVSDKTMCHLFRIIQACAMTRA